MDPVGVVVVDVFAQKTLPVLLVQYDHVIKQLPAGAADPTFRRSVLPRASIGGPSGFDAKMADRRGDLVREDRIVVVDEESRSGVFRECFAELLDDPWRRGMRGDAEMEDSSATMRDHEPHVEKLKSKGRDDQDVHRSDSILMISKKRHPAFMLLTVGLPLR